MRLKEAKIMVDSIIKDDVVRVDTDKLIPYPNNPKEHPDEQIDKIAGSIQEYGFVQPLVVDDENQVVIGHGRLLASKKLGLDEVPVIKSGDLSDAQKKALRIADNRIAESGWDEELLTVELEELEDEDYDIDELGFEDEELSEIHDNEAEIEEDDFEYEEPDEVETDIERGDIFQLGEHRLMCGDATNEGDVENLMDGSKADMVFTDPPWGVDYTGGSKEWDILYNDDREGEELISFFVDSFSNIKKYHKEGKSLYTFFGLMRAMETQWAIQRAGYSIISNIIWNKNHAQFGNFRSDYKYKHEPLWYCGNETKKPDFYGENNEVSVWKFDRASRNEYHSTQKPVKLVSKAIRNSSLSNDIVLDPFGGSGSTLIACEQLDRTCYMMELDEHYCDVIIRRYINYRLDNNLEVNIKVNGEEVDYEDYLM